VLREDEATYAPQPSLTGLEDLVDEARATGLPVRLEQPVDLPVLPAGLDLTAYRILQEALTNAARHAGPAQLRVTLTWSGETLAIDVSDDGRGPVAGRGSSPGGGFGLIGLRERATSVGGGFDAGPGPDGGFRVRATLPLTDQATAVAGRAS
jgi:signal transduction histidine kinase